MRLVFRRLLLALELWGLEGYGGLPTTWREAWELACCLEASR